MNMMPLRLLPTRAAACLAALAWATPALAAPVPELSFTAQPTRYVVHAELAATYPHARGVPTGVWEVSG